MGVIEDLGNTLTPHVEKVNTTLNIHGWLLQERLQRLEDRISDLGRPSTGDFYFRRTIQGKFIEGTTELFTTDVNEFLAVQFVTINGLTLKTPAFKINAGGVMILAYAKEGIGTETPGGDVMILPGEKVDIVMSAEGSVEGTLGMTRFFKCKQENAMDYGLSEELLSASNTHDPARDVIMSKNGEWTPTPGEVVDSGGRPPIIR